MEILDSQKYKNDIINIINKIITKKNDEIKNFEDIDLDSVNKMCDWFRNNNRDYYEFLDLFPIFNSFDINLGIDEKLYLEELYNLIKILKDNKFVKICNEQIHTLVNSNIIFGRIGQKIAIKQKNLKVTSIKVNTTKNNIEYWNKLLDYIINIKDDEYIENVSEITDQLYRDYQLDLKYIKIPLLVAMNKYQIQVYEVRNKIQINDNILRIDEKEVQDLFTSYGYDYNILSQEQKDNLLIYGNIQDIKDVFEIYKKYNIIIDNKNLNKYILLLYKSNKNIFDVIEQISKKYGLDIKTILQKTPSAFMRKINNNDCGAFNDFVENMKLLDELGYDIIKSYDECSSVFVYPNNLLKHNVESLKLYGFDISKGEEKIKLSGLKSHNILFVIDQFIECSMFNYLKENTSRLKIEPDSFIFYRLYYINKYNSNNNATKIDAFAPRKGKLRLKGEVVDINNNSYGIDTKNKKEAVNAITPPIFEENFRLYLEDIISNNSGYIDNNVLENPIVRFYDENFFASNLEYVINDKVFSRYKFLRLYSLLKDIPNINQNDLALYCLTYNSIMTIEEFNMLKSVINDSRKELK